MVLASKVARCFTGKRQGCDTHIGFIYMYFSPLPYARLYMSDFKWPCFFFNFQPWCIIMWLLRLCLLNIYVSQPFTLCRYVSAWFPLARMMLRLLNIYVSYEYMQSWEAAVVQPLFNFHFLKSPLNTQSWSSTPFTSIRVFNKNTYIVIHIDNVHAKN